MKMWHQQMSHLIHEERSRSCTVEGSIICYYYWLSHCEEILGIYISFSKTSQHADKQNKREDLFHLCILRIEVLDYENRKGTSLLACATSLQLQVLLHINIYISIFQTEAMSHDKKNCALMIKRDYRPDPHRPSALYCCRLLAPS